MSDDRLDALFFCEHFEKRLAVKHCLRRREERIQVKHPRTCKLMAGPPANGFCASSCTQGRVHREALADVPVGHCERCGTAYVGAEAAGKPCEECEEVRTYAAPGRARGFIEKPDITSTRIWGEGAPDAPIGPPPGASPLQKAVAQARAGIALATAVERHEKETAPRAAPEHLSHTASGSQVESNDSPKSPEATTAADTPARSDVAAMMAAVMTDAMCKAGCGRKLRKNNTTGWCGYCNAARYAAGERPPRKSRAQGGVMVKCEGCGGDVRAKGGKVTQPCFKCRKKAAEGPKSAAPAAAPAKVAAPKKAPARCPARPKRPARKDRPARKVAARVPDQEVDKLTDEDLLQGIEDFRAELERRRDNFNLRAQRIDESLSKMAGAA